MAEDKKETNGTEHLRTPPEVQSNSRISNLPPTLQHHFETELRTDLSNVRVHEGHAPTLLGAQAFSSGENIYFSPGHYQPHTENGRKLLAHELAHVVQQRSGGNNGK